MRRTSSPTSMGAPADNHSINRQDFSALVVEQQQLDR
jgi:hypothetical protein